LNTTFGVLSIIYMAIKIFLSLVRVGSTASPPFQAPTLGEIVSFGIVVFLVTVMIIMSSEEQTNSEELSSIAEQGSFSSQYFIGGKGIYKGKKLLLRWGEIADLFVIHEYLEIHSYSGRGTIYKKGTIRVITKDGRAIDIKNVISPKEIVEYIKNTYLKNSKKKRFSQSF